jgi:hypothetical protein
MKFTQLMPWVGAVAVGVVGIIAAFWFFLPPDSFKELSAILLTAATTGGIASAVGSTLLKQIGERDLETLRAGNARANAEHQIVFSGLRQRQSDCVAQCYGPGKCKTHWRKVCHDRRQDYYAGFDRSQISGQRDGLNLLIPVEAQLNSQRKRQNVDGRTAIDKARCRDAAGSNQIVRQHRRQAGLAERWIARDIRKFLC